PWVEQRLVVRDQDDAPGRGNPLGPANFHAVERRDQPAAAGPFEHLVQGHAIPSLNGRMTVSPTSRSGARSNRGLAERELEVVLLATTYVICAFGTTIGFHRYFTHRGFETRAPVKAMLAILGCMTMQGPLTQWVTDHRKHHALSDKPGDPHSPHVGNGDGAWGAAKGFVHAHVGWLFSHLGIEQGREYGKDLYENRLV